LHVKVNDNIVLVGTAHISKDSVNEVKEAIDKYKPDIVAVELCKRRYDAITKKDQWENTPITSLLRSNNSYLIRTGQLVSKLNNKLNLS